ncbi:MAG: hypothetical protein ACREDS_14880 [Limisphaerales bacterium]
MKPDSFEQKLQRQSLRQIPGEWRAEILAVAGRESRVESRVREPLWPSTLSSRLSTFLWPHPKAWAGLAAIWIFIFALNFSMRDKSEMTAEKITPPSPEVIAQLRQQRLLFAQLMGSTETQDADRQKTFLPKPQSECEEFLTA